jgi:hypothetical protein
MNKSLCVLICFLVGILVYSLIRSYCNCGVVEGAFTKSPAQTAISGNMCHKNDTMCADIIDASRAINCPGHGSDVCGFNVGQWDELNGTGVLDCALGKKLTKAVKAKGCTSGDGADEINYLQWYIGCSGHQDFTCNSGDDGDDGVKEEKGDSDDDSVKEQSSTTCDPLIKCSNGGKPSGTPPNGCSCDCSDTAFNGSYCDKERSCPFNINSASWFTTNMPDYDDPAFSSWAMLKLSSPPLSDIIGMKNCCDAALSEVTTQLDDSNSEACEGGFTEKEYSNHIGKVCKNTGEYDKIISQC